MRPSSAYVDPARKYLYREENVTGRDGSSSTGTALEHETDASSSKGNGPPPRPPSQGTGSLAENGVGTTDRWNTALSNVTEIKSSLESLQKFLVGKAVYLDEDPFTDASENAQISRTMRAQERRIQALERELDSAVIAAGHARAEKKQAEIALRSVEAKNQQLVEELENTTQVFKLHAEELRAKSQDLLQKNAEIKVLQAIIDTISGTKKK